VREVSGLYESERMAILREKEEQNAREAELKATIQRLRETLAGREMRFNSVPDGGRRMSRSGMPPCLLSAPPDPSERDSQSRVYAVCVTV
jgi:hypothetical protein